MSHTVLHFPDIWGQWQKTVDSERQGRNIVSLLSQGQAYGTNPLPVLSLSPPCRQRTFPSWRKEKKALLYSFRASCCLEPLIYPLIKRGAPGCNLGLKGQKQEMGHPRSGKGAKQARDRGLSYISVSFRWLWPGPKEGFPWCLQISYVFFSGLPWIPSHCSS